MFPLAFVARSLQGHWWGFISRNYEVWPIFFLMNVFIAIKGSHFWILIDLIHYLFHKILSINIILKSIKGHNSVEKFGKIILRLSLSTFCQYQSIYKILSKSINWSTRYMSINKISTSIKGHNTVENEGKILFEHPNLYLVNINTYTKFDRNPQMNSQDIKHNKFLTLIKGHNSVKNW